MSLFRTDPDAALRAAQTALAAAQERIARLQADRVAKIEHADDGAYVGDIAKIDAEIAKLQASVTAHHDRIAVIQRHQREREQANREQQKLDCIAAVRKAIPRRQAAVERVDALLKQLADAVTALDAADNAIFESWPAIMPPAHRFGYLRAMRIGALSAMRKQRPMQAGLIRELVNRVPFDFSAEVQKRSGELIAELEGTAVPELLDVGNAA